MEAPSNRPFTLDDFKKQLKQITRLGPMRKVMGMIPGMGGMLDSMGDIDPEQDMKQLFGIIDSMTPAEKRDPKLIDQSRRRRIAAGSGVEPHQVNELVKMFEPMAQMMKAMAGKGMKDRMKILFKARVDLFRPPIDSPSPWRPKG